MNPADTTRAISCAAAQVDALRATLACSGPVEAMVLMPLIAQAQSILNTLEQLKTALQEVQS
jgi:ABC-type transporter Mla MlaB component